MAVSIFLAIAVRQSWSGLRLIAIDDPVQQMDDLNANAFFDLIRGLVPSGHQFLIATCDQQLYRMALEKFACLNLNGKHRFIGYRLKGVSRHGPQIIRDAPSRN
jgi:exonuclease SbcC